MEIERKFLVADDSWKQHVQSSSEITQFYLTQKSRAPTVRLRLEDGRGILTLKYPSISDQELVRDEFEYSIPAADVMAQIQHATGAVIQKRRHRVPGPDGKIWEVDVFTSPTDTLVLAEIELTQQGEAFERPDWLGDEVTQDRRYSNFSLSFKPTPI